MHLIFDVKAVFRGHGIQILLAAHLTFLRRILNLILTLVKNKLLVVKSHAITMSIWAIF